MLAAVLIGALALPRPGRDLQAPTVTPPSSVGTSPSGAAVLEGPAASSETARFEVLLLSTPRPASLDAATGRVAALWGEARLERTSFRTHFDQVRRLDLPAVLELFHPGRRETCFVALLALDKDRAVVAVGNDPPFSVPVAELDRLWTREAVFLWRDPAGLQQDKARAEQWTREALSRLGYGDDLGSAVGRFQQDAQLLADGVIGSRTLMTLYSLGRDPRPRLHAARGPS